MKAILTYHSLDDSGSPISVRPEVFAEQHAWLAGGGVRVLPLEELVALPDVAEDAVALTFDDAFHNMREAAEQLRSDGLPVTVFVVPSRVGATNEWGGKSQAGIPTLPLMGWSELEDLVSRGAQVESHTRNHPPLTRLSPEAQDAELRGCQEDLARRLGVQSTHVCYPYGDVNDGVAAQAAHCYRFGYTTEFRCLAQGDDPLRLPRLDMYYFRDSGALETWGTAAFRRRILWCQWRRRVRASLLGGAAPPTLTPPPGETADD